MDTDNVLALSITSDNPVQVHYRTLNVEGVDVFYREAGPLDAPTILLLHGFGA